ncbi:DUF58 domain-containing protein [Paenibacillus sambharensis]|uniref:DUF58 domain-containing protein n=1 Tax=Paenibacillus sambharensis TaxID=1803190 RepID=A0A2W1LXJ8_9BACL|nr:DUF58 domain-containing protein [Paenibacillus sambharensis]PZD96237.1 DUF58 domain-containing protein [Paenibacillus sambharensis]
MVTDGAGEAVKGQAPGELFPDLSLLHRLERMTIASRSRVRGTMQGKRKSNALGSSLEFADYRAYTPGDDFRRIDWNVYGRTGRAYIRQFWDEQEIAVRLWVDVSRSMCFESAELPPTGSGGQKGMLGMHSTNKLLYALRLAACIGYAGLAGEDKVEAAIFEDRAVNRMPPLRGRGSAARLFAFLTQAAAAADAAREPAVQGNAALSEPFRLPGVMPRTPGQSWVFTDGLYESGIEEALSALTAARQDVVFVHVLGPGELKPELTGERRLIDVETGSGKEVAVGPAVLKAYQAALAEHCEYIRQLCSACGCAYIQVDTGVPFAETVLKQFHQQGLLKG